MSHSVFAFSASHRWLEGHCPASIRMSRGYPSTTSAPAELGTAVHECGEFAISLGINPEELIGLEFNKHIINEKMAEDAGMYKGFVDDMSLRYGVKPLLEQRVVMSSLGRNDVYGTSDCTHIAGRILHTSDYKNGYGVVEVEDNSQLTGYSAATLDTFNLWDKVDTVVNTIIQPNGRHIQGPIRTSMYTIDEMYEWREKYRRSIILAEDPNQRPNAGEWCHFCLARANCRARLELALKTAYTDVPMDLVSVGEIEVLYSEVDSTIKFLEAIRGRALDEARKGHLFNDYKLVKSYSRAKCNDENEFIKQALRHNVNQLDLYNQPRLKGKTAMKKLVPKELVDKYFVTPPASSTLVSMTDNRPAMRVGHDKAEGIFQPIGQKQPSAEGIFQPIV